MDAHQQDTINWALKFLTENNKNSVIIIDSKTENSGSIIECYHNSTVEEMFEIMSIVELQLMDFVNHKEYPKPWSDGIQMVLTVLSEHFDHVLIGYKEDNEIAFAHNETISVAVGLCEMFHYIKNKKEEM